MSCSTETAGPAVRGEGRFVSTAEIIEFLGLEPGQLQLETAVHEAGHIVVGDAAGMTADEARIHGLSLGGTEFRGDVTQRPLPDVLAMCAGGFAAAAIWLKGRGVDTSAERVSLALNAQAGGDLEVCRALRAAAGVPHLPLDGPLQAAADVLAGRWRTVLRLAYVLRRHNSIYGFEIRDILAADPAPGVTAAYQAWSARFASQLPQIPSAMAPGAKGNPGFPLSADVPAA
jgi:hypothetical protein